MLTAVIVAAGNSRRAGFDKIAAPVAGRTVIGHTIAAFQNCGVVDEVVVVVRADRVGEFEALLGGRFNKLRKIIAGGAHRQDSVQAGLVEMSPDTKYVAVHDAARPLVTPALIERVFDQARQHEAAAAARPVSDTLKRADNECHVAASVDREGLYAMQTPQIFARDLLVRAYEHVAAEKQRITDEVSAVQLIGGTVAVVPNLEQNFKITYADDLRLADFVLRARLAR